MGAASFTRKRRRRFCSDAAADAREAALGGFMDTPNPLIVPASEPSDSTEVLRSRQKGTNKRPVR